MANLNNIADTVQTTQKQVKDGLKQYIYDIVALIIIAAIVTSSLNALGFVDLSDENVRQQVLDILIEFVPYFMAAILLNINMYQKGVFVGKNTELYKGTALYYSKVIEKLSGKQIEGLDNFCKEYNEKALKDIQEQILKKEGLSYERFVNEYTIDNKTYKAYISCTEEELKNDGLNDNQIKVIVKAKNTNIKGISSNLLLSSINVADRTDIGSDEKTLAKVANISSTIRLAFSTLCMSLIAIKNIQDWGWSVLILVIFKVAYVAAKSYMSYFKGYNNITVDLRNHISRKTDILKMYLNYVPENVYEITVTDNVEPIENITAENKN